MVLPSQDCTYECMHKSLNPLNDVYIQIVSTSASSTNSRTASDKGFMTSSQCCWLPSDVNK